MDPAELTRRIQNATPFIKLLGIEITTRFFVFPNLTDTGRYRIEFDQGFRVPLFAGFTWGISLYDRFDSRPQVAVQRNDYGLLSTLGYKF